MGVLQAIILFVRGIMTDRTALAMENLALRGCIINISVLREDSRLIVPLLILPSANIPCCHAITLPPQHRYPIA